MTHRDDTETIVNVGTKTVIRLVLAAIVAITALNAFTVVPTGSTGVRSTFGQIDEQTVQQGFNFKVPFVQKIELVNNKQQDVTDESKIWSETAERTAIYYEGVTVTYQISTDASAWIFANVTDYKETLITSQLIASAVKASSKTLSDEDATNRGLIEPLVQEQLQKSVDQKYKEGVITINKVTISNVDFDDSYNEAIEAKQRAQIEAEHQAIDNRRAIEKAEADAQIKRTEAQAKADAILAEAEAQAKANELLQESLTDELLREMYIEKWNGELPRIMSGDSATILDIDGSVLSAE